MNRLVLIYWFNYVYGYFNCGLFIGGVMVCLVVNIGVVGWFIGFCVRNLRGISVFMIIKWFIYKLIVVIFGVIYLW